MGVDRVPSESDVCVAAPSATVTPVGEGYGLRLRGSTDFAKERAIQRLGSDAKGGLLHYEWELQRRGVWHLHFVLGMETAVERVWATEYVRGMRRTLLNFVAKSGVTMRALRNVRVAWAWKEGHLPDEALDPWDLVIAVCMLERFRPPSLAP